jgi:hypothetical protein
LVHTTYSLKGKIYINRFLRSINWFVGSGGLVMTVLQIHRSLVQSQTAPEQKKSITIYQAIRNQKMKSGVSFFALFMILFPTFCKRGRFMFSESEFQSDFESVILYSANKIVTYIVGSRMPTINVIILTGFLIPCRLVYESQRLYYWARRSLRVIKVLLGAVRFLVPYPFCQKCDLRRTYEWKPSYSLK